MGEQLLLDLGRGLPVAVSPLATRRGVCRRLRAFGNEAARIGFELREYLEDVALLEQVWQACREQERELKRAARRSGRRLDGRAAITYVCKPEGRRALRLIERLSERIGTREPRLCA